MKNVPCSKCGAQLRPYYLKDGVCNGCRNPESIVVAVVAKPKFKALDGVEYYTEQELCKCKDSLNEEFDDARLTAESGLARMYEITYKRAGSLKGWKLAVIRKALKAAYKLIYKL